MPVTTILLERANREDQHAAQASQMSRSTKSENEPQDMINARGERAVEHNQRSSVKRVAVGDQRET